MDVRVACFLFTTKEEQAACGANLFTCSRCVFYQHAMEHLRTNEYLLANTAETSLKSNDVVKEYYARTADSCFLLATHTSNSS